MTNVTSAYENLFLSCSVSGKEWKELALELMEGLQSETDTTRMIQKIQQKYPLSLTEQVHVMMHKWWRKKGRDATIEELRRALDIIGIQYIEEEYLNQLRKGKVTSEAASDSDDDAELSHSEIDERDPNVSRLMAEYEMKSPNHSFEFWGETRSR